MANIQWFIKRKQDRACHPCFSWTQGWSVTHFKRIQSPDVLRNHLPADYITVLFIFPATVIQILAVQVSHRSLPSLNDCLFVTVYDILYNTLQAGLKDCFGNYNRKVITLVQRWIEHEKKSWSLMRKSTSSVNDLLTAQLGSCIPIYTFIRPRQCSAAVFAEKFGFIRHLRSQF